MNARRTARSLIGAAMAVGMAAAVAVLSAGEASAAAGDVTISFTAKVDSVNGSNANGKDAKKVLGVKAGDTLTGTYTYNATTADGNEDTTVGDYQHSAAPYGIRILSNKKVIAQTDPANVNFLVEIVNRDGQDNYLLRSYNNINASHISWQLDDPTGSAVQSDALPTTPPVLAAWQSIFGLQIEIGEREGPRSHINAHVTQVSTVSPAATSA